MKLVLAGSVGENHEQVFILSTQGTKLPVEVSSFLHGEKIIIHNNNKCTRDRQRMSSQFFHSDWYISQVLALTKTLSIEKQTTIQLFYSSENVQLQGNNLS
jgi:hypothetical protein